MQDNEFPRVTAVIPTTLRSTLPRAIRSVRGQVGVDIELIVVIDLAENAEADLSLAEGADRVLFTGGKRNGSSARNIGIMAAEGAYVAFLDDDDEWLPEKSMEQVQAISNATNAVASCSIIQPWNTGDSVTIPKVAIANGQRVENYLFAKRGPSIRRASLFTSTLLCDTALARSCLWDEGLSRHQDWEWLLKLQEKGASFVQLAPALTVIHPDSPGSISAKSDWESSLIWAKSHRNEWNGKTYVDFLASQTLRYSLQAKSSAGIRQVVAEMYSARQLPSGVSLATGCAGLLPKRSAMRLLSVITSILGRVRSGLGLKTHGHV